MPFTVFDNIWNKIWYQWTKSFLFIDCTMILNWFRWLVFNYTKNVLHKSGKIGNTYRFRFSSVIVKTLHVTQQWVEVTMIFRTSANSVRTQTIQAIALVIRILKIFPQYYDPKTGSIKLFPYNVFNHLKMQWNILSSTNV